MKTPNLTRKLRPGRGALWLISGLLLLSGVIRFAVGTAPAIAREMDNLDVLAASSSETHACQPDPDIATLLTALRDRATQLDEREAALADRLSALALAEQEIAENLEALEAAERKLAATLAIADTAAEDDLARLTSVYENMKPKEASALFEEMAPEFAAGFLGRMRPDAAAAIMAGLQAPTAYQISVLLAGRNALAPKE